MYLKPCLMTLPALTLAAELFEARNPVPTEINLTSSISGSASTSFTTSTISLIALNHTTHPNTIPTACVHTVNVSGDAFHPETLHAGIGDIINFYFHGPDTNYSVAESTFFKPCQPKTGGVDQHAMFSGFVPVIGNKSDGGSPVANKKFSIQINNTDPIWLYCPSEEISCTGESLCQAKGMAMVVNPLNVTKVGGNMTLAAYKDAAAQVPSNVTTCPNVTFGGNLVDIAPPHLHGAPYALHNGSTLHLNNTWPGKSNGTEGVQYESGADIDMMRRSQTAGTVLAVAILAGSFAVGL